MSFVLSPTIAELIIRFVVMLSLTIIFGGLGFLLTIAVFKNLSPLHPVEFFGRFLTIGLAFVILLVFGLSLFGISISRTSLSIALFSICGLSLLKLIRKNASTRIRLSLRKDSTLIKIALPIILFLLLFFLRLVQIRNVIVPYWYGGFIHTYLLEEFANRSVIPLYYVYPVGFQAVALVVNQLLGLTLPQTILLSGQWVSIVCGINFYIFSRRYIHNVLASGLSFIAFSCVLLFPTSLLAWGLYDNLLGLALLLPAIIFSIEWIKKRHKVNFWAALLLVVSLGYTHYGSLLIWFSFILVYLINKTVLFRGSFLKVFEKHKAAVFRSILLILSISIIIFLKELELSRYNILNSVPSQSYDPNPSFGFQNIFRRFRAHDYLFIFIWFFWLSWSLIYKRNYLYITFFWPLAIWTFTWIQPRILENPFSTYLNLLVFLSIPLSLSLGLFVQQFLLWLIKLNSSNALLLHRRQIKNRLSVLLIIAISIGLLFSPLSIDQNTALFTDEDALAMKWIKDNTTENSGFLIRNIRWDGNTLLPSDGGGWIPYLTGRRTIIPKTGELADICKFAIDHGVNYVYFGKNRGYQYFDLRISDLNNEDYVVVYGTQSVEIASLICPLDT